MKKAKILAAKILFSLLLLGASPVYAAGIPVFDGASVTQSTIIALESITQTINEIEQLRTQLQQYEDMIKNSVAPAMYIWSKAEQTMSRLQDLYGMVDNYTNSVGGIDKYLQKFMTPSQYAGTPYFNEQNMLSSERRQEYARQAREARQLGVEAQITANQSVVRGAAEQRDLLQRDAAALERLQSQAQSAEGRMAALQYANQFAAMQNDQLLQLRSMLTAQQSMLAAQSLIDADEKAQSIAKDEAFLSKEVPRYDPVPVPKFGRK